jgi:hypothetical protein
VDLYLWDVYLIFKSLMYKRECPLFMRGRELLLCRLGENYYDVRLVLEENCYDVDWIHEETPFVNLPIED